jgi:hypothetical protein
LKCLFKRHEEIANEMKKRGYSHKSPLDPELATGLEEQNEFVDSVSEQIRILKKKKCGCRV